MRLIASKRGEKHKRKHKYRLSVSNKCIYVFVFISILGISIISMKEKAMHQVSNEAMIHQVVTDTIRDSDTIRADGNEKDMKYRFAYAFLVAGCKPESPSYKGYIYNIAIANDILKSYNSTADVVVMIRMHTDTSHATLPSADEDILTKTGVIVKYIPKPLTDNFHTAMMDKFRILELTEYDRVIYLDSDILPLRSIDYIFQRSVGPNATLQENVIISYNLEPSSGGFFMLKPNKEDYLEITKIIERRENEGYNFNETIGWGHVITPPDYWEAMSKKGTAWTFYGAFTDQGLLYYWTKYYKKNVSIFWGKYVRTWKANEKGESVMIRDELSKDLLPEITLPTLQAPHRDMRLTFNPPTQDFHHFVEKTKPWLDKSIAHNPHPHVDEPTNVYELWFNTLRKIEAEHHFGIDTTNVWVGRPTLGNFPAYSMVKWAKEAREKEANLTISK